MYNDDVQVLVVDSVSRNPVWLGPSTTGDFTYTQSELEAQINTIAQRLRVGMLRGFSGSASPSNDTKYGSGVTTPVFFLFVGWLLSSPSVCHVYPSAPALE